MRTMDDLLDRGPAVLPTIVPAETDPVPAAASLPTAPLPRQAAPDPATALIPIEPDASGAITGSHTRPRVRRVTRVVRHIDTWSVLKVALVFHFFLYITCLTAGVLLWQVAQNTGTVDNIERFFESFGWVTFDLKGGEIFHNAWVGGLFLVIGATGLAVLAATLFNLITDLVGGIRVSVLEEEVVVRGDGGGPGWRMPSMSAMRGRSGRPWSSDRSG